MAKRNPRLSDILLERGRASLVEYRKVIITLSLSAIGVYFVFLTKQVTPALTEIQKWTLIGSIVCMALSAFSGFLAWKFDYRRFYSLGEHLAQEVDDDDESKDDYARKLKHLSIKADRSLEVFFVLGVTSSVLFLLIRI